MIRRRGSSLLLSSALVVTTGLAFAAGTQLRHRHRPAVASGSASIGTLVAEGGSSGVSSIGGSAAPTADSEIQGGWDTFEQVYALVREHYVDTLPGDTKMARGAARAMVANLEDPDSLFLEPTQRKLVEEERAGHYAGIGAILQVVPRKQDGYTDYKITVVDALPGSPAEKAGLKAGDIISRIDGKYVLGYNPLVAYIKVEQRFRARDADEDEVEKVRLATRDKIASGILFPEVSQILRGAKSDLRSETAKKIAEKSTFALQVERAGAGNVTVSVTPGETPAPTASVRTLDGGAAYVKVPLLTDSIVASAKTALASLPGKPGGVVLDLRGAAAGTPEAARALVGLVSGPGAFAVEVGPSGKSTLSANGAASVSGPICVLVDRSTAGLGEAVAAGLHDKAGAAIVGTKTFGDARSVRLFSLKDGSGFTLRTGKWNSVKGVAWADTGLTPQVAVAPGASESEILKQAVSALTLRPSVAATPVKK